MGEAYAKFIEAQLANELARRDSVNTRAATALTTATGLVTLALAVLAVLRGKDFVLTSGQAKVWLIIAVIALFVSAVCAVGAGVPWTMQLIDPTTLDAMVGPRWKDPADKALKNTAFANTLLLKGLQRGTARKFWLFLASGIAQIVAVFALAACVLAVAFASPHTVHPPTCWWVTYCRWGDQGQGHHHVAVTTASTTTSTPTSTPPTVFGLG